ncbi:MAG: flavin reductase family protein [Clostridia bacterium]|nr:flavin reductase family protein [Clostridia bacterium]
MKKDLGVLPAVFPMPVLMIATYDENGVVDVMNAAWGMISDMDQITLFLGQDRKTVANMKVSTAFTVALADQAHMKEADFFGIATGNKMPDKFARTGLTAVKSAHVNAPIIEEFPLVMECELDRFLDDGNFFAVIGKIVNTAADESVLDERGKVEPAKLNAILFDQFRNGYYAIGEKVGKAWNAGAGLMKE